VTLDGPSMRTRPGFNRRCSAGEAAAGGRRSGPEVHRLVGSSRALVALVRASHSSLSRELVERRRSLDGLVRLTIANSLCIAGIARGCGTRGTCVFQGERLRKVSFIAPRGEKSQRLGALVVAHYRVSIFMIYSFDAL
jgi:hypothetical protein